jgi:hypothetical protein
VQIINYARLAYYTFHPKFSKNVHNLDCPVVLPPQGPAKNISIRTSIKSAEQTSQLIKIKQEQKEQTPQIGRTCISAKIDSGAGGAIIGSKGIYLCICVCAFFFVAFLSCETARRLTPTKSFQSWLGQKVVISTYTKLAER